MSAGMEYEVEKRAEGSEESSFLSIKLSASMKTALEKNPDNSFIEFTSKTTGVIHIGEKSHSFSIRQCGKTEVYETTSGATSSSTNPKITFLGPVVGKVSLQQRGITVEDTALIRQKTEIASKEFKKRKALVLSNDSSTMPVCNASTQDGNNKKRSLPATESESRKKTAVMTEKKVNKNQREVKYPEIVLRKVPCLFSMQDILNFLSGIQIRSENTGFVVVFLFDESQGSSRELFMDVYVEFASTDGAEIALQRNNEEIVFSGKDICVPFAKSVQDHALSQEFVASYTQYEARMEALSNSEIFCAKYIGLKICAENKHYRLPAITVLNNCLTSNPVAVKSFFPFLQLSPQLLINKFPKFFRDLDARIKGNDFKQPRQWLSLFGGPISSNIILEPKLRSNEMSRYRAVTAVDGGEALLLRNDVVVMLSTLVDVWSHLAFTNESAMGNGTEKKVDSKKSSQRNSPHLTLDMITRQIQFYRVVLNSFSML